jgi:hypothetical protein
VPPLSSSELWHKERLLNLAIQRLPASWEYVAWVDADVIFARPDWAEETVHLLQHHQVVQMFSTAIDLTPRNEVLKVHKGIIKAYHDGLLAHTKNYDSFHPGFAWAARRETLDHLGGLLDTAILGAGDRHMALALLGILAYKKGLSLGYVEDLRSWIRRASKHVRGSVGYMDGLLLHYWHGKKNDRHYGDRWNVLIKHQFDPNTDLKCDTQGVYQIDTNSPLQYDINRYFASRQEDSIDL